MATMCNYSAVEDGRKARRNPDRRAMHRSRYCMLNDTPSVHALAAVAPGVRFNVFAILATPAFFFASVFSLRTSSFVQSRRTIVFFLANLIS